MSIPERLDLDLYRTKESALSDEWGNTIGRWLLSQRHRLTPWAPENTRRTRWTMDDIDDAPGIAALRQAINQLAQEAGLPVGDSWVAGASACHHRMGQEWWKYPDEKTAKAAFMLTLHTPERMFEGGQLEFWSGARVDPAHCTLTVWKPDASFRIVPVECWAAGIAFARWSIEGITT